MAEFVFYIVYAVVVVWLGILTAIMVKFVLFFRTLSKDVKKGNLIQILEKVVGLERKNTDQITELKKQIVRLDKEGLMHIQKLAVVRFNPFDELGGDHSFVCALLDGKDNGYLLTSLHTREKTRIYMKEVIGGKSGIKLSKEEEKAIVLAQNKG